MARFATALTLTALCLLVPRPAAGTQAEDEAGVLALVGATILDGTGRDPVPDGVIVVADGRIQALGPRGEVEVPSDARVLDLAGKWVLPGLVDSRVHLSRSGTPYGRPDWLDLTHERSLAVEREETIAYLDDYLRRYIYTGVTAAIDSGGPESNFNAQIRAEESPLSPRLAVGGPVFATSQPRGLATAPSMFAVVALESEVAERLSKQLLYAPRFVEVDLPPGDANIVKLLPTIVAAAHASNLRVVARADALAEARAAVAAGVDLLVGGALVEEADEELLAAMKEKSVIWISALAWREGLAELLAGAVRSSPAESRLANPDVLTSWRTVATSPASRDPERAVELRDQFAVALKNVAAAQAAGVRVVAGSGAGEPGTPHGPTLLRELELLVEAGLTARDALLAATRNGAFAFSAEPDFGFFFEGLRADMIVVDADPLVNVRNVQRLHRVVLGGRVIDPAYEQSPDGVVSARAAAFNAHDVDRFFSWNVQAWFGPVGGTEEQPAQRPRIKDQYAGLFRQSDDIAVDVSERITTGPIVMCADRFTGKAVEAGQIPPRALKLYRIYGAMIHNFEQVTPQPPEGMTVEQLEAQTSAAVQRQLDAYNAADIEAFVDCFHDNVLVGRYLARQADAQGKEQLRANYTQAFESATYKPVTLEQRIVVGNFAVDLLRAEGAPPQANLYQVQDGRIQRMWRVPNR